MNAGMQIHRYTVYMQVSLQVCKYANMPECMYATMKVYNYASVQVCTQVIKYANL